VGIGLQKAGRSQTASETVSETELDDLTAKLTSAIAMTLKGHLKPIAGHETAQEITCRTAYLVASIALSRGGPTRPFRHLAKRQTGRELRRIVKACGRTGPLSKALGNLNANAISALADAGWTRSRLLEFPEYSASAARDVLSRLDQITTFVPPDLKPVRLKEIGIAKTLLHLFRQLTPMKGSPSDAGLFVAMLEAVDGELPINLGNLQSLARAAIRGRVTESEG
jgi:hypothetical protein